MLDGVIVIPCYNEAKRLNLAAFRHFARHMRSLRLLMVNDGSRDNTAELLDKLAREHAQIEALHLSPNGGKAEAVRRGILHACEQSPDFVGYLDADLATPLEEVPRFIDVLTRRDDVQVVIGSRMRLLGRNVRRRRLREFLGRSFALVASHVIGMPLRDTQCGAKVFRVNEQLQAAFSEPFNSRWIFDVEILARLKNGYQAAGLGDVSQVVYELPLDRWEEVPGSKLKSSDFVKAIGELYTIFWRYRWLGEVIPPQSSEDTAAAPESTPFQREHRRAA